MTRPPLPMSRLSLLLLYALGALAAGAPPAVAQHGTVVSRSGRQLVVQLRENVGVIGGTMGDVVVPETQLTSAELMVSAVNGTTATCTIFHESDEFPAQVGFPVSFARPVVKGTLVVTSDPPGAAVTVGGGRSGRTPSGRLSLPPGTYTVGVTHAGFASDSARVTVTAGEVTAHHATLQPLNEEPVAATVRLLLTSTPGNARIFVNGAERGYTPEAGQRPRPIDLPAESPLLLEVRYEKHASQFDTLAVEPGQVWEEHYVLEEKRAPLDVLVYPWGSEVYADGAPLGRTPLAGLLPMGRHTIRVERAGFTSHEEDVVVWEGQIPPLIETALGRDAGWLRVRSAPAEADVRLDGVMVGQTPLALRVPPGHYDVVIEAGGAPLLQEQVDVAAGGDETVAVGSPPPASGGQSP